LSRDPAPAPDHPAPASRPSIRPLLTGTAASRLAALACSSRWILAHRGSLAANVHEVIGLDPEALPLACQMVASTRTGICQGSIAQDQAEGIASRLALNASTIALQDLSSVAPLAYEGEVECLEEAALPGVDGLPVWWIDGRPADLALSSGGQFEYLLIVVDPASGAGCIQVSYSYG
jgi:hypothetical protein